MIPVVDRPRAESNLAPSVIPTSSTQSEQAELAEDLQRLEHAEREQRDRQREESLARLREVARFD